ncbi:MAG: NHLP family bacteriocin export ABC transporter peptidase/permease/ATPase, partial [Clostridia bacterium]|nr:NHLP family bacteriocin export ABC transporter peptidase/permease/ATPase [Clostridia bacterium]
MSNATIKSPLTKGVAKVPVIMQMEALECGAACLAMISAYYEKWIPLEQVRIDCGVSRDGSKARNILVAARSYGFTAKGYRYDLEDLKKNGKFPCIIHWNFNHFVVLNGFKNNKAMLNDPAKGAYRVSMEVLDEAYTG